MKRISIIILAAVAISAASSCTFIRVSDKGFDGSGSNRVVASKNMETKSFAVPQFSGIDTSIPADIDYIMTDGEPSIKVEAPDNFIDRLSFEVEDGILMMRFDDNRNYSYGKITVNASSATLEKLTIRGAGDFNALSGIDCTGLNIDIQGAGDIDLKGVRCSGDMSVAVRGAGDINVEGLSCRKVTVEVMGAGDADIAGKAESAELSVKGVGDIDVTRLDCQDISSSVAGMGSIKRK